ncbi:MAG: NUDIX hydrolase [bacterium]
MRAPFQILAIPYRLKPTLQYCVLHRSDIDQYQFVAGGGEDTEKPIEAAAREIYEETSAKAARIVPLTSMAYIPANVIAKSARALWSPDIIVIPEYAFGFLCEAEITVSREHTGFEWLGYQEAMARLTWDSNKTALYELHCRLLRE